MTKKIEKKMKKKFRKNSKTFSILTDLRLNQDEEDSLFKSRDIYNVRVYLRNKKLSLLTSIQTLMKALTNDEKWFTKTEKNEIDKLQYLFFISTNMQILLVENLEILIINCIYKINRYKMSLLIIIDITNLNIFFYIDFCFMKEEHFEDYIWVLEIVENLYRKLEISASQVILSNDDKTLASAITRVYDIDEIKHELCVWHIEKNVIENCKKHFDINENFEIFMKSFKQIIYSSTKEILQERYQSLHVNEIYVDVLIYIENNVWINRKK